jgi:hypothetical protein
MVACHCLVNLQIKNVTSLRWALDSKGYFAVLTISEILIREETEALPLIGCLNNGKGLSKNKACGLDYFPIQLWRRGLG